MPYVIINTLDFLSLITNPKTYVAFHGKSIVSFCCIKHWGRLIEIGNAYTMPRFRRHGHFKELLHAVLKKHKRVYILTHGRLIDSAKRYGFKPVKNPPLLFCLRKILAYAVFGLFYRPWEVLRRDS